jgi:hypothetical protein
MIGSRDHWHSRERGCLRCGIEKFHLVYDPTLIIAADNQDFAVF